MASSTLTSSLAFCSSRISLFRTLIVSFIAQLLIIVSSSFFLVACSFASEVLRWRLGTLLQLRQFLTLSPFGLLRAFFCHLWLTFLSWLLLCLSFIIVIEEGVDERVDMFGVSICSINMSLYRSLFNLLIEETLVRHFWQIERMLDYIVSKLVLKEIGERNLSGITGWS